MAYRIDRLNSIIREQLSLILQREFEFPRDVMVTVLEVRTSGDTMFASARISVLPNKKEKFILEKLNRSIGMIQKMLNKRLIMKFVPRISFVIDKTTEKIDHFEGMLKSIEKER